jgi:hypothetical protein
MSEQNNILSPEEAQKIEQGEALEKDYFYIPVFYFSKESPNYEGLWYSLRFTNDAPPASLTAYASKVPKGSTLWDAVRHDLKDDFRYPVGKSFVIEEAKPFDTARAKDGRVLTRLLVWVSLDTKFNVDGLSVLGMHPHWYEEGEHVFNLLDKYFD